MRKLFFSLVFVLFLTGCASWVVQPQTVVLLPEDKIYSIPAGIEVKSLKLDKKEIGPLIFPSEMKLVSPTLLTRQEQQLNDATFKKINAEKKNNGIMTALTAIFGAVGGIVALFVKNKVTTKK